MLYFQEMCGIIWTSQQALLVTVVLFDCSVLCLGHNILISRLSPSHSESSRNFHKFGIHFSPL